MNSRSPDSADLNAATRRSRTLSGLPRFVYSWRNTRMTLLIAAASHAPMPPAGACGVSPHFAMIDRRCRIPACEDDIRPGLGL